MSSQNEALEQQYNLELPPLPFSSGSASLRQEIEERSPFSIKNFLIPEWQGEGLLSREALRVKKIHKIFIDDAKAKYRAFGEQNQTVRQTVFREFISYLEETYGDCHHFSSPQEFWDEVKNPDSKSNAILNEFEDVYCFRSVTIYMLKARFLIKLYQELKRNLDISSLIFLPHSFSSLFPKGSSMELQSEALQTNQYSWYRPSENFKEEILALKENFSVLSVTEINKIFTHQKQISSEQNLDFKDVEYSHALSHKSWGLLLSEVLVTLPNWSSNKKVFAAPMSMPKVLKTKFVGNHLRSLSLSHWLSQEENSTLKWNEMICPDFVSNDFKNGQYFKIFNELMFLGFAVNLATHQGFDVIPFICKISKDKYQSTRVDEFGQTNLLTSVDRSTTHFDRVFLNLTNVPKKNPHHFLINQIQQEMANLSINGNLFVLTNQNLFVPSHADKVETLLKTAKLECLFSFEELKGKGEIADYLYVFKKITPDKFSMSFEGANNQNTKSSCLCFKFSGELERFSKFQQFVNTLKDFLANKAPDATPLFQTDLGTLTFEFHQDAILKGKLLSLLPTQKGKITHPSFFKNLTKTCIPFEEFFQVESLDEEATQSQKLTDPLFWSINLVKEERFPLVLIVNFSQSEKVDLELIPRQSYEATRQFYGTADYQYFGLAPKKRDININLFRDYFKSDLGNQIIQMSLNGGRAKTKAKLNALLVPLFFAETTRLPEHIDQYLKLAQMNEDDFIKTHPSEVRSRYEAFYKVLENYSDEHPWHLLSHLSNIKFYIEATLNKLSGPQKQVSAVNYNNPLIIDSLTKAPTINVFPDSEEVFSHFEVSNPQDVNSSLEKVSLHTDTETPYLELKAHSGAKILIYSSLEQLHFTQFILNSAAGAPLSDILQHLRIPKKNALLSIIQSFSSIENTLNDLHIDIERRIYQLMTRKISRS